MPVRVNCGPAAPPSERRALGSVAPRRSTEEYRRHGTWQNPRRARADPMTPQAATIEAELSPYYISMAAAISTQRSHVLKQADSFAVLDHFGDIRANGSAAEGVFFEDTRYLSRFVLSVDRLRPMLLSSTVTEDNAMLSTDLANPDLFEGRR